MTLDGLVGTVVIVTPGGVVSNVQVFDVAVVGPVLTPSVAASCATVATTVSPELSAARSVRS